MKIKILLLISLVSVAFLAMIALCANWDNQENLNADQLIGGGEVAVITPPEGQAATPQASRELQKNKSTLDWTMPSTLTGGGDSAKESRDQAGSAEQTASSRNAAATAEASAVNNTASTAESELPPSTPAATTATASLAGSWSFALKDDLQRNVTLALFQNGEWVYGTGNMKEGESTLQVTAAGTVRSNGTEMDLDLVSLGTISLYKLDLGISGESATGNYQAFSANGQAVSGSAEGTLIAPM